MSARDRDEKLFSEDIERLLRGEEAPSGNADPEYEEMLRFAHRLLVLREEPRPEFVSALRQRLLVGAAEHETARRRDTRTWFERVFGQPGLRLAMVSTFVVLAAVGLVWRAGLFSAQPGQPAEPAPAMLQESDGTPPAAPAAGAPSMLMTARDDDAKAGMAAETAPFIVVGRVAPTNAYGGSIAISLEFRNNGPEGMMLSPFPPEVNISSASTGQTVYTFAAGTSQLALSSMESTTYDIAWDQSDAAGTQVAPGSYEVSVQAIESQLEKGETTESPASQTVASFDVLPEMRDAVRTTKTAGS